MKRTSILLLAAFAALTLTLSELADAARMGGGRSFGAQRQSVAPAPPAAAPPAPSWLATQSRRYVSILIPVAAVAAAGLMVPPEKLQSRTATVFGALTRMFPISPASKPPGHPGATLSPTAAPGSAKIASVFTG